MARKLIIDSAPFRERECPRPMWTRHATREQWREAWDIAKRFTTMPYGEALQEFHLLPLQMLMLVRARWAALRGLPIDWIVYDADAG